MVMEQVETDRVLIVAKTHMLQGICVSALTQGGNKGLRLRTSSGSCLTEKTRFNVGEIWDIAYRRWDNIKPPHIEDICVYKETYVGKRTNIRDILLARIQPWIGGPEALFDGALVFHNMSAYVGHEKPLPAVSTGYWLSDRPLTLIYRRGKAYYWLSHPHSEYESIGNAEDGTGVQEDYRQRLYVRYVGVMAPQTYIPPQTLLRVSLARWWVPHELDEERCYLQLSGWYLNNKEVNAPVSTGSVSIAVNI